MTKGVGWIFSGLFRALTTKTKWYPTNIRPHKFVLLTKKLVKGKWVSLNLNWPGWKAKESLISLPIRCSWLENPAKAVSFSWKIFWPKLKSLVASTTHMPFLYWAIYPCDLAHNQLFHFDLIIFVAKNY